jgi:phosphohistidine phosphatase SixA
MMPWARIAWTSLALGLSAVRAAGDPSGPPASTPRSSIVILVRHAEKSPDPEHPEDPPLSEAGRLRARRLAAALSDSGVTHLFSSQYRRTSETLRPLAEAAKRPIRVFPAEDMAGQVAALKELPAGSVAVVAGHSNTVPGMACALAGRVPGLDCSAPGGPKLDEGCYDLMFVVPILGGSALVLRYGD